MAGNAEELELAWAEQAALWGETIYDALAAASAPPASPPVPALDDWRDTFDAAQASGKPFVLPPKAEQNPHEAAVIEYIARTVLPALAKVVPSFSLSPLPQAALTAPDAQTVWREAALELKPHFSVLKTADLGMLIKQRCDRAFAPDNAALCVGWQWLGIEAARAAAGIRHQGIAGSPDAAINASQEAGPLNAMLAQSLGNVSVGPKCCVCGAAGASKECSACTLAPRYCSRACQAVDWKQRGHRDACRANKKAK
jgi:hypothetical protein